MSTPNTAPLCTVAAAVTLALLPGLALADSALRMSKVGALNTGGAEIGAFDPASKRVFVTNAIGNRVEIVDASNPSLLVPAGHIDVSALGSPNSVAVSHGIVAVAIEAPVKTDAGKVGLYRTDGAMIATVDVGALPDMLTFTPNGRYLLVANEGEPSGYAPGLPGAVDPVGSISIIRMPEKADKNGKSNGFSVQSVDFSAYNGQETALRNQGIRIYGPNASAAQDLEPEYIAVTDDSRTAYVTLQENNAVAKIDIHSGKVIELLPLGYKDYTVKPHTIATYEWPAERLPAIGTTPGSPALRLGGFSGLAFEGVTADGELKFIANTDRGPNGEPNAAGQRPFLLPGFNPQLVRFTLDPHLGKFKLTEQILLRDGNGGPLSGLPNTAVAGGSTLSPHNDEVPIGLDGAVLPLDRLGGDFEGIAVAADGSFWLPDEYRPALYHFAANGNLLQRYIPVGAHAATGLPVPAPGTPGAMGVEALPSVLGQRRQNRGMEGIAIRDGRIYGFVQSPIRNAAGTSNGVLNARVNVRVVEFDPSTLATRQFLYVMDNPLPSSVPGANDTRADKIGDAVATPEGFLVVERDDDAVGGTDLSLITKKVYAFSLGGATPITAANDIQYGGKVIDAMTVAELSAAGITPIAKTLEVDLATAGYADVQKVEGLALLGDGRLAVVNDNDFQVAQIVIDAASGSYSLAPGYQPESTVVGLISRPGLDASDRDGPSNGPRINIRQWPVFGMYQPDAIATFKSGGRNYFVTANEGDARDYTGFSEEARVGTLNLDPVAFPDGASLKANANLGRLTVTRTLGNPDGDADFEALYTLGGRSFSIWSTDGALVYDSESALERITSIALPTLFNADQTPSSPDTRSDNKGPEPEGLAIGLIHDRTYAFVALERVGDIAAFDISNPTTPVFMQYTNDRTIGPATTQAIGPEGLQFISASDSPTGAPLLLVTSEVSGVVSVYSLTE